MGFGILSLITSSEMVLSLSLCKWVSELYLHASSLYLPEPNRLKLLKSILGLFFFLSAINL
jgi:hypothetical protein